VGADHPSVAITLNNLAVNARKRELPDEAETHYLRALAILEGRVEADHPNFLLVLRNYAKLLRALGREEEAGELERRWEEAAAPLRLEKTTDTVGRNPMSTEDVEAHGWGANTNEDTTEDAEDRDRLSSNTNEDADEDDVEAHGWGPNTNEDAASDDD
jgi:tetratricopeptide (TPR) repeat protein